MAPGKNAETMATQDGADGPDAIDVHVGARMRLRRTLMGITQTQLGQSVGLTFQQIQKYERGANRISASKLWLFGQALDVPVSFFFDDLPGNLRERGGMPTSTVGETSGPDPMVKRETLELMKAYHRIEDPSVRKRLGDLFKAVANASDRQIVSTVEEEQP